MKKVSILIVLFLISSYIYSQRGVRIGYVDTEYILQNLSEYEETRDQLEEKADEWRREIENRFEEIENKKEALNAERLLLTDELIKEKEEEIEIERNEILDYQQKRFGPRGDLIIQRKQLIQPIQDQIFIAIKEIAKSRKYDFIFDKSADIVMLYSDRKFYISDQILRIITRTNNRKQLDSRREKREAEQEDKTGYTTNRPSQQSQMLFRFKGFFSKWHDDILDEDTTPRMHVGLVGADHGREHHGAKTTHQDGW